MKQLADFNVTNNQELKAVSTNIGRLTKEISTVSKDSSEALKVRAEKLHIFSTQNFHTDLIAWGQNLKVIKSAQWQLLNVSKKMRNKLSSQKMRNNLPRSFFFQDHQNLVKRFWPDHDRNRKTFFSLQKNKVFSWLILLWTVEESEKVYIIGWKNVFRYLSWSSRNLLTKF